MKFPLANVARAGLNLIMGFVVSSQQGVVLADMCSITLARCSLRNHPPLAAFVRQPFLDLGFTQGEIEDAVFQGGKECPVFNLTYCELQVTAKKSYNASYDGVIAQSLHSNISFLMVQMDSL